jgi:hypothetical protein
MKEPMSARARTMGNIDQLLRSLHRQSPEMGWEPPGLLRPLAITTELGVALPTRYRSQPRAVGLCARI